MKGPLNGILKCIGRICSLKIQESPHSSNPSAARTLFEFPHILIQDVILSCQGFFFLRGTIVGPISAKRAMVSLGRDPGVELVHNPLMLGDLLVFKEDRDVIP